MRKVLMMIALLFSVFSVALAQTKTVTGKVVDKGGEPLIGVSVTVKGTTKGVGTDINGGFKLAVPSTGSPVLVFKYIGFKAKEVAVGSQTTLKVTLDEDNTMLNEVKVNIGYAIVSREAVTGSVSSTNAKQLKDVPVSSAAEALTGRLAGVQVTTTEGQPGAEVQIRVRGGGSLTQDNSPLYIVDGIQVENALSLLSPQEIQSIDVLKDAASTAIYGARGANGVVLITTKGGKEMKTQISYNGYAGVRQVTKTLDVLNPYDFVQYQYQFYDGSDKDRETFRDTYGRFSDLDLYKNIQNINWQDKVFGRDAWNQTHVLTMTGGSKTTTFNLTLNHTDEDGIMLGSGYTRTLGSFKFDHKVNDRFNVGLTTRYSRQRIDGAGTSSTQSQSANRLRNSIRFKPFDIPGQEAQEDVFDANYNSQTNLTNPVLLAKNEIKYDYDNDLNLNGYAGYDITKKLSFKTVVGVTTNDARTNTFNGAITSIARDNSKLPVVDLVTGQTVTINNSNTLNYRTTINKDHNVDLLIGEETYQTKTKTSNTRIKYLPSDITAEQAFASIQKATPPTGMIQDAPSTSESSNKLFSLFGRANYSYKSKYLATFTVRRDGSSKFAGDNRYAVFPSAQLGWRISEEGFMSSTKDWLSNLKVRASYGTSGNNRIANDLYRTMFVTSSDYGYAFDESVTPGYSPNALANPDLKWETTVSRNLGLDFSLLKNRLNGSVDVYLNNTKDLLLAATIPTSTGYKTQIQNIGKTENKGVELQLDGVVMQKKDFGWTANFNMSFNRNKIVSLGNDATGKPIASYFAQSGWVNSLDDFYVEVGKPIGQFYGYVTDGFYTLDDFDYNPYQNKYTLKAGVANSSVAALGSKDPQPGDLKLKDLTPGNNTSVIGTDDRKVLGNAQPKFTGGFNQQFTFKGFDMSIFMNWSVGSKVYNANKIEYTTSYNGYKDNNMFAVVANRWKWYDENGVKVTDQNKLREMNANTTFWTPPVGNYILTDYAIEDGSFLRISNITLGYTLPKAILKRTKALSAVRVYTTVNNLWTITGYSGFDPEANTRRSNPLTPSVDYSTYPRSRYILAGVNVTF